MCCIRHFCIIRIMHWFLISFFLWLGVPGEFYALASLHACECCHDSMLTMRLCAYVIYLPWMPVGEGWVIWIGTMHWLFVLSPLDSGNIMFSKPTRGWQIRILAYLRVAPSHNFQTNKHEMFCSNSDGPVYTCLLRASHSNPRLIIGIRTHNVFKNRYHG